MAKRFTDTDLWDKEWFIDLSAEMKCLVQYVRAKCNIAGVWDSNWPLVAFHLKKKLTEVDLLSIDGGKQFIKISPGKIYCIGFLEFQYGEILSEKSPVHRKVLALLKREGLTPDSLLDRLKNRLPNREEEKEEEEDKSEEEEKEKDGRGEGETETLLPWPTFEDFWNGYDKKVDPKTCRKLWEKIAQPDREKIITHVEQYKIAQPNKQYRKNPETYLRNESWNDEIITRDEQQAGNTSNQRNPAKVGQQYDVDKVAGHINKLFTPERQGADAGTGG